MHLQKHLYEKIFMYAANKIKYKNQEISHSHGILISVMDFESRD